jgi:hypothetical protein
MSYYPRPLMSRLEQDGDSVVSLRDHIRDQFNPGRKKRVPTASVDLQVQSANLIRSGGQIPFRRYLTRVDKSQQSKKLQKREWLQKSHRNTSELLSKTISDIGRLSSTTRSGFGKSSVTTRSTTVGKKKSKGRRASPTHKNTRSITQIDIKDFLETKSIASDASRESKTSRASLRASRRYKSVSPARSTAARSKSPSKLHGTPAVRKGKSASPSARSRTKSQDGGLTVDDFTNMSQKQSWDTASMASGYTERPRGMMRLNLNPSKNGDEFKQNLLRSLASPEVLGRGIMKDTNNASPMKKFEYHDIVVKSPIREDSGAGEYKSRDSIAGDIGEEGDSDGIQEYKQQEEQYQAQVQHAEEELEVLVKDFKQEKALQKQKFHPSLIMNRFKYMNKIHKHSESNSLYDDHVDKCLKDGTLRLENSLPAAIIGNHNHILGSTDDSTDNPLEVDEAVTDTGLDLLTLMKDANEEEVNTIKMNLFRRSWHLLRRLYLMSRQRHDNGYITKCESRSRLINALNHIHVFAHNQRYYRLMTMIFTIQRKWDMLMARLTWNLRRNFRLETEDLRVRRYRYTKYVGLFITRLRAAVHWKKLHGHHAKRVLVKLYRRRMKRTLKCWRRYKNVCRKITRYFPPTGHDYMKRHCLRQWAHLSSLNSKRRRVYRERRMRMADKGRFLLTTSHFLVKWQERTHLMQYLSERVRWFRRKSLLLRGLLYTRCYIDTTIFTPKAQSHYNTRGKALSLQYMNGWRLFRLQEHSSLRVAFWKHMCRLSKKLLQGSWIRLIQNNFYSRYSAIEKGKKHYIRFRKQRTISYWHLWKRRVYAYRVDRKKRGDHGKAYQHIFNSLGCNWIEHRATTHTYVKEWMHRMHFLIYQRKEEAQRDVIIRRWILRGYIIGMYKHAYRKKFAETTAGELALDPWNNVNALLVERVFRKMGARQMVRKRVMLDSRFNHFKKKSLWLRMTLWQYYGKQSSKYRSDTHNNGGGHSHTTAAKLWLYRSWKFVRRRYRAKRGLLSDLHEMQATADRKRSHVLWRMTFNKWLEHHQEVSKEFIIAYNHYNGRFIRMGFKHAHTFRMIRRCHKKAMKISRFVHLRDAMAAWRHRISQRKDARRRLKYHKNMVKLKTLIAFSNVYRYHFDRFHHISHNHIARKTKRLKNFKYMDEFRAHKMLVRWKSFSLRHMQNKKYQKFSNNEFIRHLMKYVMKRWCKLVPPSHLDPRRRSKQNRSIQTGNRYWDHLKKYSLFEKLVHETDYKYPRKVALAKYIERRYQPRCLKRGYRAFRKHVMEKHAFLKVQDIFKRRILRSWNAKYEVRHLWTGTSKSMMFKNRDYMLKKGFKLWKEWNIIERECDSLIKHKDENKLSVYIHNFMVYRSVTQQHVSFLRDADHFNMSHKFHKVVYGTLCAKIEKRRLREELYREMDEHRREFQIHHVFIQLMHYRLFHRAEVFHFLHCCDLLLYGLKMNINRKRYEQALNHISDVAARRRAWKKFLKMIKRHAKTKKDAEQTARLSRSPYVREIYSLSPEVINTQVNKSMLWRIDSNQHRSVMLWFRYVKYCVLKERSDAIKGNRHYLRYLYKSGLRRFIHIRAVRLQNRLRERQVRMNRILHAERHAMSKLTLKVFAKWSRRHQARLVEQELRTRNKRKFLRILQSTVPMSNMSSSMHLAESYR